MSPLQQIAHFRIAAKLGEGGMGAPLLNDVRVSLQTPNIIFESGAERTLVIPLPRGLVGLTLPEGGFDQGPGVPGRQTIAQERDVAWRPCGHICVYLDKVPGQPVSDSAASVSALCALGRTGSRPRVR